MPGVHTRADEHARCNSKASAVNEACCTTGGVEERECEGQSVNIDCRGRGNGAINIQFASYGRRHGPNVCPHDATSDQQCHEHTSTDIVRAACQGQVACSIAASNGVFGDPCPGTYKYLTVNYDCGGDTGATCEDGMPSICSSECARMFTPFYSKCASYLAGTPGLDLDGVLMLCQNAGVGVDGVATTVPTIGGFINGGFDDEEEDIVVEDASDGEQEDGW